MIVLLHALTPWERDSPSERTHRAVHRGQHRQAGFGGDSRLGPRHAELGQRDHAAAATRRLHGRLRNQRIVPLRIAFIERRQRAIGQDAFQLHAGRKLRRHGLKRRRERGNQADSQPERRRVRDHGLVGFEYGQRRMNLGHALYARTERRTREQDGITAAIHRVLRKTPKSLVHERIQAPARRQIRRQAVIQQVHSRGLRPIARHRLVDGRYRVRQRMDQRDPRTGPCHAAAKVVFRRTRKPCSHHTRIASAAAGMKTQCCDGRAGLGSFSSTIL